MDFLNSLWYAFMIVLVGLMQVGVTIALAIVFDSILVLAIGVAFWLWVDRILMNWIVKRIDKQATLD